MGDLGRLSSGSDGFRRANKISFGGVDDRVNSFAHHGGAARPDCGANFADSYKNVADQRGIYGRGGG
jgi:hypothetical protein